MLQGITRGCKISFSAYITVCMCEILCVRIMIYVDVCMCLLFFVGKMVSG
jgi:hypothetical protein